MGLGSIEGAALRVAVEDAAGVISKNLGKVVATTGKTAFTGKDVLKTAAKAKVDPKWTVDMFMEVRARVVKYAGTAPDRGCGSPHSLYKIVVEDVLQAPKELPQASAYKVFQTANAVKGTVQPGQAAGKGVAGLLNGEPIQLAHATSRGGSVFLSNGDRIVVRGIPIVNEAGDVTGMHFTHPVQKFSNAGWIKDAVTGRLLTFKSLWD